MYKFLFLTILCLGCVQPSIPPATEYYPYVSELPKNAQIVEDLGNDWIIYKVEVLGEIRWFKTRFDLRGKAQSQAITELRPPESYYRENLK